MKITLYLLVSLLTLTLGACSSLKFPGVYKIAFTQGNYIDQESVDKLELGMTKRQVRYVMGTPMLQDTFSPDRWDYYYMRKRGDKIQNRKTFTVYFENNKLVRWEGDLAPGQGDTEEADDPENQGEG